MKQQIKFIGGPWDGMRMWTGCDMLPPSFSVQAMDDYGNRSLFFYLYFRSQRTGSYVFSAPLTGSEAERNRRTGDLPERLCEGK